MMKYFVVLFILISVLSIKAQDNIEININIKNDLNQTTGYTYSFGISKAATDNLDTDIGELMLPPPAPFGFWTAFEFIDSSQTNPDGTIYYDRVWTNKDMKNYPNIDGMYKSRHKMIFRFGSGKKIQINWNNLNINEKIDSIFIRDAFNGLVINVDMKKNNSMEWDNDGIRELFIEVFYNLTKTSVEDENEKASYYYPNPVHDVMYLDGIEAVDSIKFYDIAGCLIDLKLFANTVDVSKLYNGIYFCEITTKGKINRFKFIKN